ncbi:MAG: hypothetical protein ACYSYT_08195 [Planctomycetota bacterium]|jgi:hypothetical protein
MPIVDGKYEAKISTTFRSTKVAVEAITDKIKKSRRVRISNLPTGLLEKLLPLLKGKDVKIILPAGTKPNGKLREIGDVAVQKAKIYKDYKGTKANVGSIYFADRVFSVAWNDNEIFEIEAMDYDKCVKCMRGMFDVGWRYSEK